MKGLSWTSPRGPMTIDPETRDIIQDVYLRKVEKVDGTLYNVEFATDPRREGPLQGREALRQNRRGRLDRPQRRGEGDRPEAGEGPLRCG